MDNISRAVALVSGTTYSTLPDNLKAQALLNAASFLLDEARDLNKARREAISHSKYAEKGS